MLVAGIDVAPGAVTVAVVDAGSGQLVRHGRAAGPRGAEVDPEGWWSALLAAVGDAGGFADVAAYSVAAAAGGLIALDADGRVIRPALVGEDQRFADAAESLAAEGHAVLDPSWPVFGPASSLAKLRWLREAEPENASRVEAVALPHDWLVWRLRGFGPGAGSASPRLEELVTDRSDASHTGYWSAASGRWDHELFERALGRAAIKPRVMGPDAWGGESARIKPLGIRTGLVTGVGAERAAAALLGIGARVGDVVVCAESGGWVAAIQARPPASAAEGPPRTRGLAHLPRVGRAGLLDGSGTSGAGGEADDAAGPSGVGCVRAEATGNLVWRVRTAPSARSGAVPAGHAASILVLRAAGADLMRGVVVGDAAGLDEAAAAVASAGIPVTRIETGAAGLSGPAAFGMARQAAWARTTKLPQWPSLAGS